MIIHLHHLSFFCHHGLYEEEKMTGGTFIVNLDLDISNNESVITSINETIDYAAIYEMVKKRMMISVPLLETLAMEIADIIIAASPLINKVSVNIIKLAAPIINFQGQVGVTFSKLRR